MSAIESFERHLSHSERQVIAPLATPYDIQIFLDDLSNSTEAIYRCPLRVLRERTAHCFDGALFVAAMMRRLGYPPIILDIVPSDEMTIIYLLYTNGMGIGVRSANPTFLVWFRRAGVSDIERVGYVLL